MRISIQRFYDPKNDPNLEASKLDQLLQRLYGQGRWVRSENGIEIIL